MINVLIAEDNAAYRQSLHQALTGRFPFMQITEAADGADALHQALARQYDLIFMDIRLPQGNGLDLTRAIKAVFVDSIICVITSYDLPEYRDAALRNGADRFMVKGDSTGEEIVAMVESLLQARFRTLVV
ncbi:MAG: response regulator transcription factor, partial [Woeseiaceae bacterium]|nr:response regulator transcription factor [Woeseiaceae bacterium]